MTDISPAEGMQWKLGSGEDLIDNNVESDEGETETDWNSGAPATDVQAPDYRAQSVALHPPMDLSKSTAFLQFLEPASRSAIQLSTTTVEYDSAARPEVQTPAGDTLNLDACAPKETSSDQVLTSILEKVQPEEPVQKRPPKVYPQISPPCSHNNWDDVRTRNGTKVLRCRDCQKQLKLASNCVPRCLPFLQEGVCKDAECKLLHVHKKKQQLQERHSEFGLHVLDRVPPQTWIKVIEQEQQQQLQHHSHHHHQHHPLIVPNSVSPPPQVKAPGSSNHSGASLGHQSASSGQGNHLGNGRNNVDKESRKKRRSPDVQATLSALRREMELNQHQRINLSKKLSDLELQQEGRSSLCGACGFYRYIMPFCGITGASHELPEFTR